MHRRIPKSRRHKKLKSVDPENKNKVVNSRKNVVYDEKPSNINAQEIPKKLKQLMQVKQKMMEGNSLQSSDKKRKKKSKLMTVYADRQKDEYGMSKPLKSGPKTIQQQQYETDAQFVSRVGRMAETALHEAQMETKYGIEVGYEDRKATDANDPRIASLIKDTKEPSIISKKKLKRKALAEKKKNQKSKKRESDNDFAHLNDEVKFNEVVNKPPALPLAKNEKRKPGTKDLLLKSILPTQEINLKGKRKNLPVGERRKIEILRDEAINSYREMKKRKKLS